LNLVKKGANINGIKDIRGTVYSASYEQLSQKKKDAFNSGKVIFSPSFDEVKRDKTAYVKAFNNESRNSDPFTAKIVAQKHGNVYIIQNLPQYPLSVEEMDNVYRLPYMRAPHPMYVKGVPSIEEVKYSITASRGCFGNCNYCALTYHQGKIIQKRSKESIIEEAKIFVADKDFKGYIHDLGGPTANFRNPSCAKQTTKGVCANSECIGFSPCKNLVADHSEYLDILRTLRQLEGVKKVFIRSGIRYDYVLLDTNGDFLRELIKHHISGQLKVAPEHSENKVLKLMNKAPFEKYLEFKKKYEDINRSLGKEQYLVPYLISSHPGSTLVDAIKLAEYLNSIGYMPEQVQDFYPTPSTKSTCMYYTGINPDTLEAVYVPKSPLEKKQQRALLQYRKKENYNTIKEALIEAGRTDLIGFSAKCLIKPLKGEKFS
ncbi:YgiQ family radical SAM protein, partial [bacterium]|nr:YgiQ family radical SAM protein [bacterium]